MKDLTPSTNHVAMVAARVERVWEALTTLEAASTDAAPVRVHFPFDCEILDIFPSVAQASNNGGGRRMPTLDEIVVSIQLNQDQRFTSRFAEQDSQTQTAEVSLASFLSTLGGARSTLIDMSQRATGVTQNSLLVAFKWKVPAVAAAIFEDVAVGLAFGIRRK